MQAFTRQLGGESGVQLNPLIDNSEQTVSDNSDQSFGILMRATRGRIDRPFGVTRGNVFSKIGAGETVRTSALNEAWLHVVEALNQGANRAIVQRLTTPAAVISHAVYGSHDAIAPFSYHVSTTEPSENFMFSVKHLGCYNDGIKIAFHADIKTNGGVSLANDKITIYVRDDKDILLFEFYGSLDPASINDYGISDYLPNLVSRQTDEIELLIGSSTPVAPESAAYGFNAAGRAKVIASDVMMCFSEGGTAYSTQDYMAARTKLQYTQFDYAYIASGGSKSPALIAQLALLAFDTNRQLKFDIPGELSIDAAISFVEQLHLGGSPTAHLMHAFYAPIKSDDPTGINGKGFWGAALFNIARCCLRNAQTNVKGFAPKNYPIAGREWPLQRVSISQSFTPTDQELDALARAKINPVLFEVYSGGGRYVFRDSITCALVDSSLKKLIAVADMSTSVDDIVTKAAKDMLQLPMTIAIKRMQAFLASYFEAAQASGWLVAGDSAPFKFEVAQNAQRPQDRMDVSYWLHYDGTVRQIFVTQTLTR
jgi:hypothetical protein